MNLLSSVFRRPVFRPAPDPARLVAARDIRVENGDLFLGPRLFPLAHILTLDINHDPRPEGGIAGSAVLKSRGFDEDGQARSRVCVVSFGPDAAPAMQAAAAAVRAAGGSVRVHAFPDAAFRRAFFCAAMVSSRTS